MKTVKVSRVVALISSFLRDHVRLNDVMISGELSNVKYVSGHCYFDLKDEEGQLSCTLWRSYADRAGFRLEDGMAVLVHGTINVYEKRGTLKLNVDRIEPDGLGALYLELEQRKQRLQQQGYFDQSRKKPKPEEISTIGIVTGASTAALQDALKTIRTRWPMLRVRLFPAPVQGQDAPKKIIEALAQADQAGLDAVLLIRGGGSFEDLFCFNDEGIVKQLANMKTYTVTGIGHEVDTTLADFAADHRALTPTAAAQWVTPDQREVAAKLALLSRQLVDRTGYILDHDRQHLLYLLGSSPLSSPRAYITSRQDRLSLSTGRLQSAYESMMQTLDSRLERNVSQLIAQTSAYQQMQIRRAQSLKTSLIYHSPSARLMEEKTQIRSMRQAMIQSMLHFSSSQKSQLEKQTSLLEALSWTHTLERGFAIVRQSDQVIRDASSLALDEPVQIQFARGEASARLTRTKAGRKAAPAKNRAKKTEQPDAEKPQTEPEASAD